MFVSEEVPSADEALKGHATSSRVGERGCRGTTSGTQHLCPGGGHHVEGGEGERRGGEKYRDYFNFARSPVARRTMAIRRGEAEGFLRVSISPEEERCIDRLTRRFVKNDSEAAATWRVLEVKAVVEALDRDRIRQPIEGEG